MADPTFCQLHLLFDKHYGEQNGTQPRADGRPVMLLHGWPYDIYSFVDVAPLLAAKGYRVIVRYLLGETYEGQAT